MTGNEAVDLFKRGKIKIDLENVSVAELKEFQNMANCLFAFSLSEDENYRYGKNTFLFANGKNNKYEYIMHLYTIMNLFTPVAEIKEDSFENLFKE